ncbi:hypothetical protein OG788_39050 [Streptomyces sp. NBC_00647]|uniref:hypothetical protein n=1 Tax=Streptomyces sp. NBC_00647 TaxID=2975796 RepID=UPI003246ADB5
MRSTALVTQEGSINVHRRAFLADTIGATAAASLSHSTSAASNTALRSKGTVGTAHLQLDYAQGLLYTEAGHHGRATSLLRAALDHQHRTYGRNRALYRLTLARSLINSGDVDEGAAQAVESLDHLNEVESGRVLRRLAEVVDLLADTDAVSARHAAEELTDYVQDRGAA